MASRFAILVSAVVNKKHAVSAVIHSAQISRMRVRLFKICSEMPPFLASMNAENYTYHCIRSLSTWKVAESDMFNVLRMTVMPS